MLNLADVESLKRRIEGEPAVSIEVAARVLQVSERTIRRRSEFELRKSYGHLFVTIRSILYFIISRQYFPTSRFDLK
jgi:hypothetical protein